MEDLEDYGGPLDPTIFIIITGVIAINLLMAIIPDSNDQKDQTELTIEQRADDDEDVMRAYHTIEAFKRTSGLN